MFARRPRDTVTQSARMRVSARPMLKGRCRLGTPAQILNARSDWLEQHLGSMSVDPARFKALRAIPQDDVSLFGTVPRAFGLPTGITAVFKLCRPPPGVPARLGGGPGQGCTCSRD